MQLPNSGSLLQRAQLALSRGDFQQAAGACRQILDGDTHDTDARYFLGLANALGGDAAAAIGEWRRVLESQPRHFPALVNVGVALGQQGQHSEAITQLRAALAIDDSQAQVHYNLGNSLLATGDFSGAIDSFRAAIVRNPELAEARNNLGVSFRRAGRLSEACEAFQAATIAEPAYADACNNLGSALQATGQLEAAIESFSRALALDPRCTEAALALSQTFERLDRTTEAIDTLARAAAANPDAADIHYALGVAYHRAGQLEKAFLSYERTLALRPDIPEAWRDRGLALERVQKFDEALESYAKAAALAPDDPGAVAGALGCSVRICDWTRAARSLERLRAMPSGLAAIHPFLALRACDDPADQLQVSTAHCRAWQDIEATPPRCNKETHRRIRVAYISSDLRDHPVAYVLAGVLERHDRDHFEIHAVSLQPEAVESAIGRRLRQAVEHHHDVAGRSDTSVARLLHELKIDIAVDLNGHTVGARPGIFARRAAPVQVNYLGYAGTLGAREMDYVLADAIVIPAGDERWYSEQVVRLPHCYLPFDDQRAVGKTPTRAEAGLPTRGTIFCAFTNAYKISEPVFEIWMRLLRECDGSVLWLRDTESNARENLQRAAEARGVNAERLVFAPRVSGVEEHLGRHALADLYLDTLPYNAHSTACDALWAGLPVLTCTGRTFASRVAASALTAVGLPELITNSLPEYETRALELARDPHELQSLRERLKQNRASSPLFDTARFTRYLEAAYSKMHERRRNGERPEGFTLGV